MALWLRSRHAAALVLTLLVILALGTLAGQRAVVLPTVIGTGANGVLLTTFLPLVWAAALADAFAARTEAVNLRPSLDRLNLSRLAVCDATLFLGAVALTAGCFAVLVFVSGPVLAGVGPVLILSGTSCLGTVLIGPAYGVLAASSITIVTTVYGPVAPWSDYVRVLQPDGNITWSVGVGVFCCAVATWALLTDHVTHFLGATDFLD